MPISFICNSCTSKITAPENAAGKSAKCPRCGSVGKVPNRPSPARPRADVAAPEPSEFDSGFAFNPSESGGQQRPLGRRGKPVTRSLMPWLVVGVIGVLVAAGGIYAVIATRDLPQPSVAQTGGKPETTKTPDSAPLLPRRAASRDPQLSDMMELLVAINQCNAVNGQVSFWFDEHTKSDFVRELQDENDRLTARMETLDRRNKEKWGSKWKSLRGLSENAYQKSVTMIDGTKKAVAEICKKHADSCDADYAAFKAKFLVENPLVLITETPTFSDDAGGEIRRHEFQVMRDAKNRVLKAEHNAKLSSMGVSKITEFLKLHISWARQECASRSAAFEKEFLSE